MNPAAIDPTKTKQAQEWKHANPLIAGRCDPGGKFAFTSSQDNTLQRWEIPSGKKTVLTGHAGWVRTLAFYAPGKLLLSGDYHGKVLFWNLDDAEPKPLRTIEAHDGWVRMIAVSPNAKWVATCGNDRLVKIWSLPDGQPVRTLAGHSSHVYNVAFHPTEPAVVSADLMGVVRHWDLANGTMTRELDAKVLHKYDETFRAHIGGIRGMAFSPDGKFLACAGISEVSNAFAGVGKPLVLLFDWAAGKVKHALKPKDAFQGTAWGVAIHPAGYVIATGAGNGGALWFWKLDTGESMFALKFPNNARDLDVLPDGQRLLIPFADGVARLYEMTPKEEKK